MEYLVTSLKKLTNKRWLVHINYEPAFVLYVGELKQFNIKEDSRITEADYSTIMTTLGKRATVRAMSLLKSKDYTTVELRGKLEQGYYPQEAIDIAVDYVSGFGYLDDYRYASNYISFKATTKSKKQIVAFLQQKGISASIIEQALEEFYDDNGDAELEQVTAHMRKKLTCCQTEPDYEVRQKLMAYYYRKGFASEVVRKALDIVVDELFNN